MIAFGFDGLSEAMANDKWQMAKSVTSQRICPVLITRYSVLATRYCFSIVTLLIFTGSNGRSLLSLFRGMRAIFLTIVTVAGSHCPMIVNLPFRCGCGVSVMKNWLPLVFGPSFA